MTMMMTMSIVVSMAGTVMARSTMLTLGGTGICIGSSFWWLSVSSLSLSLLSWQTYTVCITEVQTYYYLNWISIIITRKTISIKSLIIIMITIVISSSWSSWWWRWSWWISSAAACVLVVTNVYSEGGGDIAGLPYTHRHTLIINIIIVIIMIILMMVIFFRKPIALPNYSFLVKWEWKMTNWI